MFEDLKFGILGGGQLGTMLIRHAIDFGISVSVMDNDINAPSARYTSSFTCGNPSSYEEVMAFGKDLDILTIEKEAVNTDALRELCKRGVKVYPSPDTIEIIQDKYKQKCFLKTINIPVAEAVGIWNREQLYGYINMLPACLKLRRSGYDGNGVMVLNNEQDISMAFDAPSILEELVSFEHEISVLVARNENGEVKCYEPTVMVFNDKKFILEFQSSPAYISEEKAVEATGLAEKIAKSLNLIGILAVEMFLTKEGKLVVNELAPRPHNSGHHTIEACLTSQYEQHLRAVLGLPLGKTEIHSCSVMVNILQPDNERRGHMAEHLGVLLGMKDVHLHWYGKKNSKAGRKIGHVTIIGETRESVYAKAEKVRTLLNN